MPSFRIVSPHFIHFHLICTTVTRVVCSFSVCRVIAFLSCTLFHLILFTLPSLNHSNSSRLSILRVQSDGTLHRGGTRVGRPGVIDGGGGGGGGEHISVWARFNHPYDPMRRRFQLVLVLLYLWK
jgi:hypothetical protein